MGGSILKSDLRALRCWEGGWGRAGPSAQGVPICMEAAGKGCIAGSQLPSGGNGGELGVGGCHGREGCRTWAQGVAAAVGFRSQLRGTAPQTGLVSMF